MPARACGTDAIISPPRCCRQVRSSATRSAPNAINSSASEDFPTPARPRIRMPCPPSATQLACKIMSAALGSVPGIAVRLTPADPPQSARQAGQRSGRRRSGGCFPPKSRRHAPRRSAWKSPTPTRSGRRTAQEGAPSRTARTLWSAPVPECLARYPRRPPAPGFHACAPKPAPRHPLRRTTPRW
ncbi:hypothetical protein GALL_555180 [mine drainage metagenome]|uniref:Uncharacterized protein n=1 Tax=mine drainage metagenome TaxID=410659 RepID=A0A1J5NW35_9ZZZZ